ncbi:MAG: rhodanese-like domain-containing protein [Solirubrobacterales bacterium]
MFSLFKKKYDSISTEELSEKIGKINLIDVRENYEFKAGHVPKAKNIPMGLILSEPEKYLAKDKEYHIICHSGSRSSRTCRSLSSLGYQVVNIIGGTASYTKPLKR